MFQPDRSGLQFGPFWFTPGYSALNVGAVLYFALSTMVLVTFMGFVQPFLLLENFHIPKPQQGSLTGNLAAAGEVVAILVTGLLGAWSDRVGRRFICVGGLCMMAVGYSIYPLARTLPELFAIRVFYSLGASAVALMLTACVLDTVQETSRAKWVGIISILNGMGVLLMGLVLAQMPQWYVGRGAAPPEAGRLSFWTVAALCLLTALMLRVGLRGPSGARAHRESIGRQLLAGLRAGAANPRLALAYGSAFVGRGDLLVVGTFFPLWLTHAGTDLGVPTAQALAKAGLLFGVVNISGLLWSFCMGVIADRVNRVTGLCVALAFAATGYTLLGLVDDPFALPMIPICILVGVGQTSVIVAGSTLLGQEAGLAIRGTIAGLYSTMASLGILFVTFVGGQLFSGLGHAAPFIMMGMLNALLLCAAFFVRRLVGVAAAGTATVVAAGPAGADVLAGIRPVATGSDRTASRAGKL